MQPAGYRIETRLPDVASFNRLRESSGWWALDPAQVEAGLAHSLRAWCALQGEEIVGIVRLVGDGAMKIALEELIVHPDHRRQGIAHALMREAMAYIDTLPPRCTINLMAAPGAASFYLEFGFEIRPPERPGMQLRKQG